MGQKIHPTGFRVGYIHDWKSNWFDERNFSDALVEDVMIRRHIEGKLAHAGLSDIEIRKQAIGVLASLKDNTGVDKLLDVARNEKNLELRKQAVSYLTRTKDPRALQLLQEIILR